MPYAAAARRLFEFRADRGGPKNCSDWDVGFLSVPLYVGMLVFVAYRLSTGSRITWRGTIAYLLAGRAIVSFCSIRSQDPGPFIAGRITQAALLLLAAALVSGWRPVLFRRATWITAPAVVTAVEPVKYRDVVRWRIRFAYFDGEGVAQESADEVVVNAWKPGDSVLAVFQPNQPDLATMKPVS